MTPQIFWKDAPWEMKENILIACAAEGGYQHDPYLVWTFDLLPVHVKAVVAKLAHEDWKN